MRAVSAAYECYRNSNVDLSVGEVSVRYRILAAVFFVVYATLIILLEELMTRSYIDASPITNRVILILLITGVFVAAKRALTVRALHDAFGEMYTDRWSLIRFYRGGWLYLRYLRFRDLLCQRLASESGRIPHGELEALATFANAESEDIHKLTASGFSARYAAYAIGLFITIFSKLALKFTHPVLVDIMIVIAAVILFSNQLSSRIKPQSQKLAELSHFIHWLQHESEDFIEPPEDDGDVPKDPS